MLNYTSILLIKHLPELRVWLSWVHSIIIGQIKSQKININNDLQ